MANCDILTNKHWFGERITKTTANRIGHLELVQTKFAHYLSHGEMYKRQYVTIKNTIFQHN